LTSKAERLKLDRPHIRRGERMASISKARRASCGYSRHTDPVIADKCRFIDVALDNIAATIAGAEPLALWDRGQTAAPIPRRNPIANLEIEMHGIARF